MTFFPNLRFPGFEGSWECTSLGNCAQSFEYGMNASAIKFDGENRYIRITDIDESSSKYKPEFPVSPNGQLIDKYLVCENDILFARTGASTGKSYLYNKDDGKLYFAGFLIRAKIKAEFNSSFVFMQTKTIQYYKWVQLMSMRSGQPGINSQEYASYSFNIPSKNEQDKITSIFILVDERIQTQKKIIEDLQITKKEISIKLFKEGFDSSESKIENLQKLGDLTYVVNRKNKENFKLPVYSINNKKGFVSQSEQFEGIDSDERGYDISLYKIIEKETFAYNPARINVGSIGYSGNLENIIISSLYVCFKTIEIVDDEFLFQYLRTDIFRKEVLRNVEGGVRDYLFYENFSRIKINLPDLKEQIKIAKFLSKIDGKINLENKLLTQYENQKKYLLQNLFV